MSNLALAGCTFALMLVPVSLLFLLLPANGIEPIVYYKRLLLGLGLNALFSFFMPFAINILPAALKKTLFFVIAFLSVIFVTVSVFHLKIYHQQLSAQSLTILLDTNFKEAREYAGFYSSSLTILAVLAAFIIMLTIAAWAWRSFKLVVISKIYAVGAFLLVIALGAVGWNKIYFAISNPIPFFVQMGLEVSATHAAEAQILNAKAKNSGATLTSQFNTSQFKKAALHLIILGESATPSHMSLYGYERETNPQLKQAKQGLDFFLAKNSCSSQPSTHLSIADIMLGGQAQKIDADGAAPANMLSIMKDAGYQIDWLSNQQQAGYGAARAFWSGALHQSVFLNKTDYRLGYDFDETLLPAVESALTKQLQPKVVVVHMLGSHPGYMMRYPKKFERWAGAAEVPDSVARKNAADFDAAAFNAYDNSLLYSDYVIAKLLTLAQKHQVASVVYFSDHGQNLGETNSHVGHSTENGPRQGFSVPLLFWLNTDQLTGLNLDYTTFKANLEKPFSLERIEYSLFDLYGIVLLQSQPEKSLFSNQYQVAKRHCDDIKY